MVRLHWQVTDGPAGGCFVPPGGIKLDQDAGVRHLHIEMELAGQNETCPAMITMPASYLDSAAINPVGICLAHGRNADAWQTGLMQALADHFAARGHVVARYYCRQKEQRRLRLFERTLDAAMACPLAHGVRSWVLVGFDNGARIAAGVAFKPREKLAGLVLVSYPLLEPQPPPPKQKQGAAPPCDSMGPLHKLSERQPRLPALFIIGELDPLCPTGMLKEAAEMLKGELDMRAVVLEDLNGRLAPPGTRYLAPQAVQAVIQHTQTFLTAVQAGDAATAPLPRAIDIVPSEKEIPEDPASPKGSGEPSPEPEASDEADEQSAQDLQQQQQPTHRSARRRADRASAAAPAAARQQQQAAMAAAAAGAASAGGMRPAIPPGMVPVMGPAGPMLVTQQQFIMVQQQMLAGQLQKQQQAGTLTAAAAQQIMQQQMAALQQQLQQQMAAVAAAQQQVAQPAQHKGAGDGGSQAS